MAAQKLYWHEHRIGLKMRALCLHLEQESGGKKDDVRNGNDFRHLLDRDRQRTVERPAEQRVNEWRMHQRNRSKSSISWSV